MASDLSIMSRRAGRLLSGLVALLALGLAAETAITESMPELHLYDGVWMLGGAGLAVALVAPLVWRWPRERALLALVIAVTGGAWGPLVVLALRAKLPIVARLRGAVFFSSADIIGVALPVGVALAWLAFREYRPQPTADAAED